MMLWAHVSPQPKRHLDRFSRVCTGDRRVSLYGLPVSPSKFFLHILASGPHVIHGSLGPHESGTQMATWSFQPFFAGFTNVTDWQSDRQSDRPRYSMRGGAIMAKYEGYGKATQSFHVSANNFAAIKPRLHDTTCCQTGCQTHLTAGCIVYTNIQPVVKPIWQPVWQPVERTVAVPSARLSNHLSIRFDNRFDNRLYRVNKHATGCQTALTTDWMFVYTIQPVVQPVVQPVPVVSCKRGFKSLSVLKTFNKLE